jgi:hypothetical protein
MDKVDNGLLNIIRDSILATYMENNQEATGEEAQAFATSAAEEIVKAFEKAVAQARVHSIPAWKIIRLVTKIEQNMRR